MATSQTEQMCTIDTFWRNNPGGKNWKGSMVHFPDIDRKLPLNALHFQGINDPNESPPDDYSDAPPPDDHSYDPSLNDFLDPYLHYESFQPVNHFLDLLTLEPVDQLGNEPFDQLNEPFYPLNGPFDQSENGSSGQSENGPSGQSENESVDQPDNKPSGKPSGKSTGKSTGKPVPRRRGRPRGSVDTKKRAPRRSPEQIAHDKAKAARIKVEKKLAYEKKREEKAKNKNEKKSG